MPFKAKLSGFYIVAFYLLTCHIFEQITEGSSYDFEFDPDHLADGQVCTIQVGSDVFIVDPADLDPLSDFCSEGKPKSEDESGNANLTSVQLEWKPTCKLKLRLHSPSESHQPRLLSSESAEVNRLIPCGERFSSYQNFTVALLSRTAFHFYNNTDIDRQDPSGYHVERNDLDCALNSAGGGVLLWTSDDNWELVPVFQAPCKKSKDDTKLPSSDVKQHNIASCEQDNPTASFSSLLTLDYCKSEPDKKGSKQKTKSQEDNNNAASNLPSTDVKQPRKFLQCVAPPMFTLPEDHLQGISGSHNLKNLPEPDVITVFLERRIVKSRDVTQLEQKLNKVLSKPNPPMHILNQVGNLWRIRGNTSEVIACFRASLALSPSDPDVLLNLGRVMFAHRVLEDALTLAQQSLAGLKAVQETCSKQRRNTNPWLQHFLLAEIYTAYGRDHDAFFHLRYTTALNRGFKPALQMLQKLNKKQSSWSTLSVLVIGSIALLAGVGAFLMVLENKGTPRAHPAPQGEEGRGARRGKKPLRRILETRRGAARKRKVEW